MNLSHIKTKEVAESGVFNELSSFDQMIKGISKFGKTRGKAGEEAYNDFVGAAYEVFCEFFFRRYGSEANPMLGVKHISDTSRNKFQAGYDFTYENFSGEPCLLQVKFRSNPNDAFDMNSFGTFFFQAAKMQLADRPDRLIWFTNLSNAGEHGIFKPGISTDGQKMMRVFGRDEQEAFIDRDPLFWQELALCVNRALTPPGNFITAPEMWEHQAEMHAAITPVMETGGRGRVICATGGGKTRVIYQTIMDGFGAGLELQVVVAPTIDLLRQHHATFERFGAFHKDSVSVIHFRTGDSSEDGWADVRQTTSPKDVLAWQTGKTLIFVTYASERKLFDGLRNAEASVDAVCWDEFHHTVQQDQAQREHLLTLPSKRNLFFSASMKRGRLVSADNEELYGPLLCEIKYSRLRKSGILVPKILIKVIVLNDGAKIKILESEMGKSSVLKKAAKRENFDLRTGVVEAAGTIAAHNDKMKTDGYCNAVTFSKAVAICKEITGNPAIREMFSGDLNTVHAAVPPRDRKKVYDTVLTSSDSVLCQHSVVKEGIDINPFDTVIFSRNMDVIGTQQAIGRAVRANPEDTRNLLAGVISLDDPKGWKKYQATLYVIMHDDKVETFKEFLKDLIGKLQFTGLEADDYAFADVDDDRHGVDTDDDGWVVPLAKMKNIIGAESVKSAVQAVHIEIEHLAQTEVEYKFAENVTLAELL